MRITGPTGIFGENRDHKTVIREPFANDLAHMFDECTVPLMNTLRWEKEKTERRAALRDLKDKIRHGRYPYKNKGAVQKKKNS